MAAERDEIDASALGSYGDAVDMAVKVPTLTGVLIALAAATLVWSWRTLRQRRTS
jgi:hypothetical protein